MGVYRTYFDKNNTIIKNSRINTGRNPVSELYYGENNSRLLFYCSFSELISKVADKTIIINDNTTHKLKIKNVTNGDVSEYLNDSNNLQYGDKYIASSFDLELKMVDEFWDQGLGYDFSQNSLNYPYNRDFNIEPSNWYQRTTENDFIISGGVNTLESLATQHLSLGNEDIEMDITEFVNDIISNTFTGVTTGDTTGGTTGITTNYQGLCLKFTDFYENLTYDDNRIYLLSLFTKHTNSFFEPFIETKYDDYINDDRLNFYLNKNNFLYLYVLVNGELTNLDTIPSCTITGNTTSTGITYTVTQKTKGVYYATITGDTNEFSNDIEYFDVWSNIVVSGETRPNVRMSFVPKLSTDYYDLSFNTIEPIKYKLSTSGIKKGEKLRQGEIRRVNVLLRKVYTTAQNDINDNIYYRLYTKQGNNQIDIIDWHRVNKSYNNNYFTIDTTWLIPQIYYVDIKIASKGEVNIYTNVFEFDLVNKINY